MNMPATCASQDHGPIPQPGALTPRGPSAGALAIVSHDLKGPLANLALLIEAIDAGNLDMSAERRSALTARASRLVDRMAGLLTSLSRHVQVFGDPLTVVAEDVGLRGLVANVIAQNEPLAAARGIRLDFAVGERLRLRGDPELLSQAIDNLVNNALKHTPRGGRVACEVRTATDGIQVRVIDQGPGLTGADLARAFRPFTRLSAVAETPIASSGLGLWIVRLIAENHGGRIAAANNVPGPGATFTLHLPRLRQGSARSRTRLDDAVSPACPPTGSRRADDLNRV